MQKIKVAWLTPYPLFEVQGRFAWKRPPTAGHACSWIVNLSEALAKRNDIELHLITLAPGIANDQSVQMNGFDLHVLQCGIPFLHRGFPAAFPFHGITGFAMERRKIVRALKRIEPDVVHAQGTEYAYALAAMDYDVPWIISIQGIIADYLRTNPCRWYRIVAPLEEKAVKACSWFGCRTHFDSGFVRGLNPDAHIFDLPEAMNSVFFKNKWDDPSENRVLFVGSSDPRKGLRRLIDALLLLSESVENLTLDVVGRVSEQARQAYDELVGNKGLRLNYHGFLSAAEIARLHLKCRVFAIPSENENSPNTLAEAMVSGMPCVAFDTGGIASMMEDAVSGRIVPFGDTKAMAEAIQQILTDQHLRLKISMAARELGKRNEPSTVAEKTVCAYRKMREGAHETK